MFTLKSIMRLNALSCLSFGALFLYLPLQVALFLSSSTPIPEMVMQVIAVLLLFNGLHLLWAAQKGSSNKYLIFYFSLGDFIWVIATLNLILFEIWITNIQGILATIAVSLMVGLFGIMQLIKLKEICT